MTDKSNDQDLPEIIQQYIKRLARRTRNRHMRRDVVAELGAHFADALANAPSDQDRDELAAALITDFGDTKILAKLIKRAKKRCRPLWVKFIIRTCQTILALLLIIASYTAWFVTGQPTISVDYLAKLNEMVRPTADESLNAAPHYIRACELYVSPSELESKEADNRIEFSSKKRPKRLPPRKSTLEDVAYHPGCPLKPDERKTLLRWLQVNRPAIEELGPAAAKPNCWFRYRAHSDAEYSAVINVILPHVQELRAVTHVLCWRMQFAAEKGNWGSLIEDLKSAKTLAGHIMRCPFSMEQRSGMAIDDLVNTQLLNVLRNYPPAGEVLDKLSIILAEAFPIGYPVIHMEGDTLFNKDLIQRVFTEDGSGDGHLIPSEARSVLLRYLSPWKEQGVWRPRTEGLPLERPVGSTVMALGHPSRGRTVSVIEEYYRIFNKACTQTPYQLWQSGQTFETLHHEFSAEHQHNLLTQVLVGWKSGRIAEHAWRVRTKHKAAQTVVALLRYRNEYGQFPEKLEQLLPEFLDDLPQDPFGPSPLSYKRQGDDFILYSLSSNFKDDGGQHAHWVTNSGDHVFWPPEPVERPK